MKIQPTTPIPKHENVKTEHEYPKPSIPQELNKQDTTKSSLTDAETLKLKVESTEDKIEAYKAGAGVESDNGVEQKKEYTTMPVTDGKTSLTDIETLLVKGKSTQDKIEAYKVGSDIDNTNDSNKTMQSLDIYKNIQEIQKKQQGLEIYKEFQ